MTYRFGTEGIFWPVKSSPRYGDQAAYRDVKTDYIYAWGGSPSSVTSWPDNQYVYQVRVHASKVFDLTGYEYWHGRAGGWSTSPLTDFNSNTAVMWGVGQGQVVYSNFYNCYIYVHMGKSYISLVKALTDCLYCRREHSLSPHSSCATRSLDWRCPDLYHYTHRQGASICWCGLSKS